MRGSHRKIKELLRPWDADVNRPTNLSIIRDALAAFFLVFYLLHFFHINFKLDFILYIIICKVFYMIGFILYFTVLYLVFCGVFYVV